VCVTGAGAGVDSAWEQRKLEVRKILENAAESPASSARFVSPLFALPTQSLKESVQVFSVFNHNSQSIFPIFKIRRKYYFTNPYYQKGSSS
jgi:hypothetical protein